MKNILIFIVATLVSVTHVGAAVRDGNTTQRTSQKRISTTTVSERETTGRTTVLTPVRATTTRSAVSEQRTNVVNRTNMVTHTQPTKSNIAARVATGQSPSTTSETRTGTIYETCKSAFFTCMDQFCTLKNDDYRRCSCSGRIGGLEKQRSTLNDAGQQLTVFTENLDVVGLTATQATAMRTASEGENALSSDTSTSKSLLQAILNSISGGDTTVGGKYSDLNTINMVYDLSTVFGTDMSQVVSTYNGQELYSAVYPKCRNAVAADCNNASLQRAVNAYLMAIEQDCNTVQTAIDEKQAQIKTALREGSAMLDLARVENRKKHNSDDLATCINNVESAILSEEVCGANYHKCLDNGEFIDISTGAPIIGISNFYKLGELLSFSPGVAVANQQLSKRPNNRIFVSNFENRTKKFAKPALDKCTEMADEVWSTYLDRAMLAIYYAQQSKVEEIKQGCLDFVSNCYVNTETSITSAMSELIGAGLTILQPDQITLTTQVCTDYVESCNNMFDGKIIEEYVNNRQNTDTLTACRAVVKQCFDKYGGSGYENFYYKYSGLFNPGDAGDWFTLYDYSTDSTQSQQYKSPCAQQLTTIASCSSPEIIEQAFGGFDSWMTIKGSKETDQLRYLIDDGEGAEKRYGIKVKDDDSNNIRHRALRPVGVATEIYNQIVATLTTQCTNLYGRFVERQFINGSLYNEQEICKVKQLDSLSQWLGLKNLYNWKTEEDMCPKDYDLNVDTLFWGACLCWENGARRSENGQTATCVTETTDDSNKWISQDINQYGQVCPNGYAANGLNCVNTTNGKEIDDKIFKQIPATLNYPKPNTSNTTN